MHRSARLEEPDELQPLQDLVAARVTGQQHRLAAGFAPARRCSRGWGPTCRRTRRARPPADLPSSFSSFSHSSCFFCSSASSGCIGPTTVNVEVARRSHGSSPGRPGSAFRRIPRSARCSSVSASRRSRWPCSMLASTFRVSTTTSSSSSVSSSTVASSGSSPAERAPRRTAPCTRGSQLVGRVADDVVEAVVPEVADRARRDAGVCAAAPWSDRGCPWMWSSSTWLTIRRSIGSGAVLSRPRACGSASRRGLRCGA